ncbi:hypothetical protein [uncultured Ruminococcus sp.]|uniref:hypothetical protein n=1 Tax=Ruminococcus sp. TaxID=41978 RepID=UPI0025D0E236|nr:hypothetical protein [uncultured Ruminococcus sp.]
MRNNSFAHGQELPLGLSMALAQTPAAYAYFAKLDPLQRQQIIDSAQCIRSKDEMRDFVNSLSSGQVTDTSVF